MTLKFVFAIVVLMNLKICVTGIVWSPGEPPSPRLCMEVVYQYHKVAEGFAQEDATQNDLKVAIDAVTESEKKDMSSLLTECFRIRKVKSFGILQL